MSWWAGTIPANKELVIGEDECDVTITQACLRQADSLPAGSVITLTAKSHGSSAWVPLARLKVSEMESVPLRITISSGSEVSFKAIGKGEVDITGFQTLPALHGPADEADYSDSDSEVQFQVKKRKGDAADSAPAKVQKTETAAPKADQAKAATPVAQAVQKPATPNGDASAKQQKPAQPAKEAAKEAAADAEFIASAKFTGSKAGYVFKRGDKGVGYYKDRPPVVAQKGAAPAKKSADAWATEVLAQREWKQMAQGLRYRDLAVGAPGGATPRRGQRVTVHYTGRLAKGGKQFDSSVGRKPFVFTYGGGEVIRGWDMGLDGMRVGGRRELEVPPGLGYGARGAKPDIPGNATLLFEIQLLKC